MTLEKQIKPLYDLIKNTPDINLIEVPDLDNSQILKAYQRLYRVVAVESAMTDRKLVKSNNGIALLKNEDQIIQDLILADIDNYLATEVGLTITAIGNTSKVLLQNLLKDLVPKIIEQGIGTGAAQTMLRDQIKSAWHSARYYRTERIVRTEVGRAANYGSIKGVRSTGVATKATGMASFSTGINTIASGESSFAGGQDNVGTSNCVIASGGNAFNYSSVSNPYTGVGAAAKHSAILGGKDHSIDTACSNSGIFCGKNNTILSSLTHPVMRTVIIGGENIIATEANTVYVPNLIAKGSITAENMNVTGQTVFDSLQVNNKIKIGNSVILDGTFDEETGTNHNSVYTDDSDFFIQSDYRKFLSL